MSVNPRTPVLVGYGQINHHQDATGQQNTPEPIDLMVATAREVTRSGRSGIYDVRVTSGDGTVIAEFRGHSRVIPGTWLPETDTKS